MISGAGGLPTALRPLTCSVAELPEWGELRHCGAAASAPIASRAASEGAVTAARALRNVLNHLSPDALIDLLTDEFPWISLLPEGSRSSFAVDFVQNFRISADLGQWAALDQTVHEWKATAAVCADPALAGQLTGPVEGDLGPVPPPSGFDA